MTGDDHGSAGGTASRFDQLPAQSPRRLLGRRLGVRPRRRPTSTRAHRPTPQAAAFQRGRLRGRPAPQHRAARTSRRPRSQHELGAAAAAVRRGWPSVAGAASPTAPTASPGATGPASRRSSGRHGIRLDTNYYYWPGSWVQNRPGMFTGSGIPDALRRPDGSLIDVYQATTQMTDESGITSRRTSPRCSTARSAPQGYYGAFTANMHTDQRPSRGRRRDRRRGQARGVPVISARQMLEWLDGRNGSSFGGLAFAGNQLDLLGPAGRRLSRPAGHAAGERPDRPADGAVARRRGRRDHRARRQGDSSTRCSTARPELRRHVPSASGPEPASPPADGGTAPPQGARCPPAPEPAGAAVRVRPRRVRASRSGMVVLRATCPRGERLCRIDLRLRARRNVARRTFPWPAAGPSGDPATTALRVGSSGARAR